MTPAQQVAANNARRFLPNWRGLQLGEQWKIRYPKEESLSPLDVESVDTLVGAESFVEFGWVIFEVTWNGWQVVSVD